MRLRQDAGLVQPHRVSETQTQQPVVCCTDKPPRPARRLESRDQRPVMAATWDGLRVNGCRGERGQCSSDTCVPRAAASTVHLEPQTGQGIETKEWKRNAERSPYTMQDCSLGCTLQLTKTAAVAVPVRLAGKGACEWARRCASRATRATPRPRPPP